MIHDGLTLNQHRSDNQFGGSLNLNASDLASAAEIINAELNNIDDPQIENGAAEAKVREGACDSRIADKSNENGTDAHESDVDEYEEDLGEEPYSNTDDENKMDL